jgi:hypothetical protein
VTPNIYDGFGFLDLAALESATLFITDAFDGLTTASQDCICFSLVNNTALGELPEPVLQGTMVYIDKPVLPSAKQKLFNNLDLSVKVVQDTNVIHTYTSNGFSRKDDRNTVEQLVLSKTDLAKFTGDDVSYCLCVEIDHPVIGPPQPYALVVTSPLPPTPVRKHIQKRLCPADDISFREQVIMQCRPKLD